VTDISRLSRNIFDFCGLLKELDEQKAKFFSVKEQFDTSTPVGEMMIYNMINLAQFERKQTSERVSMNFHSRALRGLLNGGNPILGYDKDPSNPGKLIVNEQEAPAVKRIFETYLESGSLQKTAKLLTDMAIKPKVAPSRKCRHVIDGRWTVSSVRTHLNNWAYVGKREINKHHKNEDQESLKPWQRYQIVKASWPAIIDEKTFDLVQKLIEENRLKERGRFAKGDRRFFLLSGVLRCGECGRALIGQASHGRSSIHRYYGHKQIVGESITCKVKRFRANEIEEAVTNHLDEVLLRAGHLDLVEDNIRKSLGAMDSSLVAERDRVQKELAAIEKDIDGAFRLYSEMSGNPDVSKMIREKMEKLTERRKQLSSFRDELLAQIDVANGAKTARSVIEERAIEFKRGWAKAGPAVQKRLLRRLVDRLVYSSDGLHAYYVTANDGVSNFQFPKKTKAPELSSGALSSLTTARIPSDGGASIVQNGGVCTRSEKSKVTRQVNDTWGGSGANCRNGQ
jgi:site-specific DNA recombinase